MNNPEITCPRRRMLNHRFIKRKWNILIFLLLLFLLACHQQKPTTEPIEPLPFPVKNVPEHLFKLPVNTLRDTIYRIFKEDHQWNDGMLAGIFWHYFQDSTRIHVSFTTETTRDSLFGNEYFRDPTTRNDIYLHCFGDYWYSRLYYSKGKPLAYRTPFAIHLAMVDSHSTKLTIRALHPVVLNGISGYSAHGPVSRKTSVESSTIEEYVLLLYLATKLGVTTLKPIKIPCQQ